MNDRLAVSNQMARVEEIKRRVYRHLTLERYEEARTTVIQLPYEDFTHMKWAGANDESFRASYLCRQDLPREAWPISYTMFGVATEGWGGSYVRMLMELDVLG